ncbi:unnamed protein product [Calypogeia fissa]
MSLSIVLHRQSTSAIANIVLGESLLSKSVSEMYISRRFGLNSDDFVYRIRGKSDGFIMEFSFHNNKKHWKLFGGIEYFIECHSDQDKFASILHTRLSEEDTGKAKVEEDTPISLPASASHPVPAEIIDLSSLSDELETFEAYFSIVKYDDPVGVDPSRPDFHLVKEEFPLKSPPLESQFADVAEITYSISALDAFLNVSGTSELSKFRRNIEFKWTQVESLPDCYNEDVVFELPPVETLDGRGKGLLNMDCENDCYSWTRLLTTSTSIRYKNLYQIAKASCSGALKCRNLNCGFLKENVGRNEDGWLGQIQRSHPHALGEQLPNSGLVCSFCRTSPFYLKSCVTKMFYIYP